MPAQTAPARPYTGADHGIDLRAPGGLDKLFALHRATFGDAVMSAEGTGPDGGTAANEQHAAPAGPQAPQSNTPDPAPQAPAPTTGGEKTPQEPQAPQESAQDMEARIRREAAADAEKAVTERLGKALGLGKEDGEKAPTVEDLTAQLEQQARETRASQLELAVYRGAEAVGAHPAAVADSRSLLTKLADTDPTDTKAVENAIREAMSANPALRRIPTRSGGDGTGTAPTQGQPTDLYSAVRAELAS